MDDAEFGIQKIPLKILSEDEINMLDDIHRELELEQLKYYTEQKCQQCGGMGWWARQISDTDCVQEQCATCYGTGFV